MQLIGTTTGGRLVAAVYDSPLTPLWSECGGLAVDVEDGETSSTKARVFAYYDEENDQTVLTTVEDDHQGFLGSSAAFTGRLTVDQEGIR